MLDTSLSFFSAPQRHYRVKSSSSPCTEPLPFWLRCKPAELNLRLLSPLHGAYMVLSVFMMNDRTVLATTGRVVINIKPPNDYQTVTLLISTPVLDSGHYQTH